jgi:L-rhamnose mutarotase
MQTVQSNQFKKSYKKLHSNQLPEINDAIKAVIANIALFCGFVMRHYRVFCYLSLKK